MSILQLEIPNARVIDLFAGSGALGLECLSRGARSADFVEKDLKTIRTLTSNIELLGATETCSIHRTDALRYAEGLADGAFDIAVADPPYTGGIASSLAEVWLATHFSSILSIEHDSRTPLPGGSETRRYGTSAITFYRAGE